MDATIFLSQIELFGMKKILYYEVVDSNGEAIEFVSKTIAVIENKKLMCLFSIR